MINELIIFLTRNKDLLTVLMGLGGIILTILGWFFVFFLNLRQQKKHLQNSAKIKLYEELHNLRKNIDEVGITLGLSLSKFSLPFLEMSFEKDPSPSGANVKALEHWSIGGNIQMDSVSTFINLQWHILNFGIFLICG